MKTKKLFRETIKKLSKINNENLCISFDHGKQVVLGEVNQIKLHNVSTKIAEAINLLNSIE